MKEQLELPCSLTTCPQAGREHTHPVDPVNHPSHYKAGGIESIDVIESFGLGFCLGNAVKYILRAGRKDPKKTLEDLKKARWYIDRHIATLEPPEKGFFEERPAR